MQVLGAQKPDLPTDEEMIAVFRADPQAQRANVMAESLKVTADEAAKAWPLFAKYQDAQNRIIEEQMRAVLMYSRTYTALRMPRPSHTSMR